MLARINAAVDRQRLDSQEIGHRREDGVITSMSSVAEIHSSKHFPSHCVQTSRAPKALQEGCAQTFNGCRSWLLYGQFECNSLTDH